MEETKGLWKLLYGASKQVLETMKEPLHFRKLKRKFQAAYDDSITQIDKAKAEKQKIYEQLHEMDINHLIEANMKIWDAEQVQKILKEEYLNLFGEDFVIKD